MHERAQEVGVQRGKEQYQVSGQPGRLVGHHFIDELLIELETTSTFLFAEHIGANKLQNRSVLLSRTKPYEETVSDRVLLVQLSRTPS